MKRILVAIGSLEHSGKVLSEAKLLAEHLAFEVTIINVVDLSVEGAFALLPFYKEIKETAVKNSEDTLEEAKKYLSGFQGEVNVVSKIGNAADEIINYAEIGSYDMIIMGSRSTGVYNRGQLGSVADKVVHYTTVPVYIIK